MVDFIFELFKMRNIRKIFRKKEWSFKKMNNLIALTIILVIFALGDVIAVKTKSMVSMLFTASLIFLILFWLGLPQTIFVDSMMLDLGGLIVVLLLVHMGTLMNLDQLKQQWKTVLIALSAVVGIALCVHYLQGWL
jgi:Na+/glutamate symporter